jgi:hypothetical protein
MPLAVLDVDAGDVPRAYRHRLVLCRADQHVAWRGDRIPAQADALVALLRGQARPAGTPELSRPPATADPLPTP